MLKLGLHEGGVSSYKERMKKTSPDEGDSVILLVAPIIEPKRKKAKK